MNIHIEIIVVGGLVGGVMINVDFMHPKIFEMYKIQ